MDPFLKKKWERVFLVFFDTNRSNMLEWNDFEIIIEKIRTMRGDQSDDYKLAKTTLKEIWTGLISLADTDKDNKVSMEEWCEMWYRAEDQVHPHWQHDYLTYMFKLLDSSGDKLIDKAEYVEVMRGYGLTEDDASEAFEKISEKSNKYAIDFEQFLELWNEYFHSKDPNAPGNYLFGAVN